MIIAGCGYTGVRLARRAATHAQAALGSVSRPGHRDRLQQRGIDALAWDLDARGPAPELPADRPVVYLVPPPADGDDDPRLAHFLASLRQPPPRIVYASTTGVYGDQQGAAVDEDTQPRPQSARARRRVAAESTLRDWCRKTDVPWVIVRIPGIYGPHRLQLATLSAGKPLPAATEAGPGNRIHVDDLVRALYAAVSTPHTDRIFNLGDGDHRSNTAFVTAVAAAVGRPPPAVASLDELRRTAGERRWSFLRESRAVETRRMRTLLGVTPLYARFEDGIRASLVQLAEED